MNRFMIWWHRVTSSKRARLRVGLGGLVLAFILIFPLGPATFGVRMPSGESHIGWEGYVVGLGIVVPLFILIAIFGSIVYYLSMWAEQGKDGD